MSLDYIIKDILRDVEKLKEIGTGFEILDEITIFTIPALMEISGSIKGVNEFSINPIISPEISISVNEFAISSTISPVISDPPTAQNTGTFLVGSARVGFSDVA